MSTCLAHSVAAHRIIMPFATTSLAPCLHAVCEMPRQCISMLHSTCLLQHGAGQQSDEASCADQTLSHTYRLWPRTVARRGRQHSRRWRPPRRAGRSQTCRRTQGSPLRSCACASGAGSLPGCWGIPGTGTRCSPCCGTEPARLGGPCGRAAGGGRAGGETRDYASWHLLNINRCLVGQRPLVLTVSVWTLGC
jgi:hypothetical protein